MVSRCRTKQCNPRTSRYMYMYVPIHLYLVIDQKRVLTLPALSTRSGFRIHCLLSYVLLLDITH